MNEQNSSCVGVMPGITPTHRVEMLPLCHQQPLHQGLGCADVGEPILWEGVAERKINWPGLYEPVRRWLARDGCVSLLPARECQSQRAPARPGSRRENVE